MQWDYNVLGTESYNSDVYKSEPYVAAAKLEKTVFYGIESALWATGRLLVPGRGEEEQAMHAVWHKAQPDLSPALLQQQGVYFVVVTVGTERTPGYLRFIKSAHQYSVPFRVYGMDSRWEGGDMKSTGGGHKVNILRRGLQALAAELGLPPTAGQACAEAGACAEDERIRARTVVLFTDSYDVVLTGSPQRILENYFREFRKHDIVFSGEKFCWPKPKLASQYPTAKAASPFKYLNSGGFIGTLDAVQRMLDVGGDIGNQDDDQGFYTDIYLAAHRDPSLDLKIGIDTETVLFLTLHGVQPSEYDIVKARGFLTTKFSKNAPSVIHGNGPTYVKDHLNRL